MRAACSSPQGPNECDWQSGDEKAPPKRFLDSPDRPLSERAALGGTPRKETYVVATTLIAGRLHRGSAITANQMYETPDILVL